MRADATLTRRNLAHSLQRAARLHGERPALALGDQVCMTYRGFAERSARIAGALRASGLETGDTVALALPSCVDFLPLLYAIWHAGLIAVPLHCQLPADQLRDRLARAGCRWCVVAPARAEELAPLVDELAPLERVVTLGSDELGRLAGHEPIDVVDPGVRAPAWLFFTSGTTGRPKAAVLGHDNLAAMCSNVAEIIASDDEQASVVHITPMTHGSGMLALPHVIAGATHVIPRSGGFDPEESMDLIAHWPNTCLCIAPVMLPWLTGNAEARPDRMRGLRTVVYGSAPASVDDLRRAVATLGPRLVQFYGMGEVPASITCLSKPDHATRRLERLASVGRVLPGGDIRVIDDDGRDVPTGGLGEVLCRNAVVMQGYWRDAEATARALRDGWLHTGDLGWIDDEGYLTLVGRVADVIETGSGSIHPRAIESVLAGHRRVREVAVVAGDVPDSNRDARPELVAFVCPVADTRVTPDELHALCAAELSRGMRPDRFAFLDALPRNYAGKVLRTALRQRLRS